MKKLLFSILLASALAACQNTDSSAVNVPADGAAPNQGAAQPAAVQQVEVPKPEKVAGQMKALMTDIKSVSDQIDALPENVKKSKATEINDMRSLIESLTEKQTMMMQELNAQPAAGSGSDAAASSSSSSIPGSSNAAALQDAAQSVIRYQQDIDQVKEKLKALSGGNQ